jgi:transketolase
MLDMAFRVAELQATLVSRRDRQRLVDAFRDYHRAVSKGQAQLDDQSHASCSQFQRVLEQLASDHPHLVSRSADLQSRVDEQWRKASMR